MRRKPLLLETAAVEQRSRGAWNRLALRVSGQDGATILYLTLHDAGGRAIDGNLYLHDRAPSRWRRTTHQLVCFIPPEAVEIRLFAIGTSASEVRTGQFDLRPIARAQASALLLLQAPRDTLARLSRSMSFRPGMLRRQLRQLLASIATEALIPRQDYAIWIALFDHWTAEDLPPAPGAPSVAYLVLAREEDSEPLAATRRSLEAQWDGAAHAVQGPAGQPGLRAAIEELEADYIGILQAGEALPPHATRLAAGQLERLSRPDIAIADEDDIDEDGTRRSPRFKPVPNHAMMLSGTLSRGLWLVRRDTLLAQAPQVAEWAEVLRLILWMAVRDGARIPYVLTHRRPDAEAAPPEALAAVVERHLATGGPAIAPLATWPLTFRLRDGAADERITVIIPSTLRQPHSLRCIRAILECTDHNGLELHVAVMQPGPLDAQQQQAAEALGRYPNATVTHLEAPSFNFSAANNRIAARTTGEHILLLNDDVSPIRRDWLRWMAAYLRDPGTGIVGARLLYPDGLVQHGGVIMGLSGLCDHAHRYLPGREPGYMSRAILAQELSAVTGACMLVRRALYERVGGLDEGYPSAFNDVDFALRVGETGHAVVYAAQAELHHHELQTYGSHYAGERQGFQAEEVRRMRARWREVCRADPFHNPNLGLMLGFEWKLALPPRLDLEHE